MTATLTWTPTLFEMNDGTRVFSSSKRYIRGTSGAGYAFATGVTCNGGLGANGTTRRAVFHFRIPGVYELSFTNVAGVTVDPGAPSPTVTNVKI